MDNDVEHKDVADRLRAVMAHLDLRRVQDLADVVGQERAAVSNWLNGYNLPPVPLMAKLVAAVPGLTLDWIYIGDANALPVALAIRLGALANRGFVPEVQAEPVAPARRQAKGPAAAPARRRRDQQAT